MTDNSKTIKPTKRRRRRKYRDRPCLEFVESPIERFADAVDYITGEPIEFPTMKIDHLSSSQWVSPQIKESERLKSKQSGMRSTQKQPRVFLKEPIQNLNISMVSEYEEEDICSNTTTRITRRSSRRHAKENFNYFNVNSTPEYLTNNPNILKEENDNSPVLPFCLSTPEIVDQTKRLSISTTPKHLLHYLFEAQTPTTRDFVILVENTPL